MAEATKAAQSNGNGQMKKRRGVGDDEQAPRKRSYLKLQIPTGLSGCSFPEWLPMGSVRLQGGVWNMHANEDWLDYLVLGMAVSDRSLLKEIKGFKSKTATRLAELITAEERKEFLRLCKVEDRKLPVKEAVIREVNAQFLRKEITRLSYMIRNASVINVDERTYVKELEQRSNELDDLTPRKEPA